MTLSMLPLFAAMFLPVFPSNWQQLVLMVILSAALLLLSLYLCAYAPSVYLASSGPWNTFGCLLIAIAGGIVAVASAAVGAFRIVGMARDWAWARLPGLLIPVAVSYLGVGLVLSALVTFLGY